MKTIILFCCLMALASCQFTEGKKANSVTEQQEQTDDQSASLVTDSFGLNKTDSIAEVSIAIDYPVKGKQPLVDSLRIYIAKTLGVGTQQTDNPDSLLHRAVEKGYAEIKDDYAEIAQYRQDDCPTLAYSYHISKNWENDRYVTFISSYYEYRGGAHGGALAIGTTFNKDNGKQLGWESFKDTDSPQFHNLIKEGVRSYFQENGDTLNDQQLKENLIIDEDVNHIPLPQFAPYMVKDGMLFIYQQYEIAAYAVGMPSFVVPLDKLKPFIKFEP